MITLQKAFQMPFRKAPAKQNEPSSQLQIVLKKIGRNPIDRGSVHRYMARKLVHIQNPTWRTVNWTLPILLIILGLVVCYGAVTSAALKRFDFTFCCLMFLAGCMSFIGCAFVSGIRTDKQPNAEWRTMPLEKYLAKRPSIGLTSASRVPTRALQTVHEIRSRLSGVRFVVHYLYEDPFIEAIHEPKHGRSDQQYVEFWDERGFLLS